eukprot:SAG31_NODE_397_length_16251_cov_7.922486_8_plen_90_part_00
MQQRRIGLQRFLGQLASLPLLGQEPEAAALVSGSFQHSHSQISQDAFGRFACADVSCFCSFCRSMHSMRSKLHQKRQRVSGLLDCSRQQ